MSNVLVLNLTRFGDLLQSQALIGDLHRAGHRVGLVCLENFAPATELLNHVDAVHPLPGASLLARLDKSWPLAAQELLQFSRRVRREFAPAFVVNLTPALPARILTRLLAEGIAAVGGFGMDEFGYGVNYGIWASFLMVAAQKRINAPFNMVDMMRGLGRQLGVPWRGDFHLAPPGAEAIAWADEFLATASGTAPGGGFVAFQLGASEDRRRWPVRHFVELGARLWDEAGVCPVLLGAPSEMALAEEYAAQARHPFANAAGKTDFMRLAALLRRSRLIVTNDTGTMHLAAGQGVPGLAFFLATAQPWDTGPAMPGWCCLEPRLNCHPCAFDARCDKAGICRKLIAPSVVGDLVLSQLARNSWEKGFTAKGAGQCRAWLTEAGADGFCRLRRLGENDDRGLWLACLRDFWRQLLDELDRPALAEPALASPFGSDSPAPTGEEYRRAGACLLEAAGIMDILVETGDLVARDKRAGQLFLRNCERLQALLDTSPPLATLAAFWREIRQGKGENLAIFLPMLKIIAARTRNLATKIA